MKKLLLSVFALFVAATVFAQAPAACSDLFISEYVEGVGNNRAIEIYNPTANAINLSGYQIGRFQNGAVIYSFLQMPNVFLQPKKAYVLVLDKRVQTASGVEQPLFDGTELFDTCRNRTTNRPTFDTASGRFVYCFQYDSVAARYRRGTTVSQPFNLACRADTFINPVYVVETSAMYFNGNDAVALVKGTSVAANFSNVIDAIGVIGENPGFTWKDYNGFALTEDRTLVRKRNVRGGTGSVLLSRLDTFNYSQWSVYPNNTFTFLKTHVCDCDASTTQKAELINCPGVTTSLEETGIVGLKMYPNPMSGRLLTIEAEANVRTVNAYNLLGELVKVQHFTGDSKTVVSEFYNLAKGIYIINVSFDNNTTTNRKLIIE